ncbi:alpha/beta fold hydrolase [Euzebya sp.]|uniref:alpha/beta fold hydrolase n=1 Tax=Euzebya sp. TaxID=1971409 RepID=UPI0035132689
MTPARRRAGAEAEYDDLSHLRRQAGIALRSLLRPGTYIGTVRELALTAVHAAAYPMGMARDANRRSRPLHDYDDLDTVVADHETARMPVLLVHGWIHNRSAFLGISRVLRRHGFRHIHAFDYNPLTYDIPEIAGMLAAEVDRVLAVTGAEKVLILGHSMGGVVARYYVQHLGGDAHVDTVVTLGSPHRGTYVAYLGWGQSAPQMKPGSALMRKLEETARPSDVRWIAVYSDLDLLILPAVNAKLIHPALRAHNIKVADLGHLSLLLSGEVMRAIVTHLSDRSLHRPAPHEDLGPTEEVVYPATGTDGARATLRAVPPLTAEG